MSKTDFVLAITDKAVRVHRVTCKRAPDGAVSLKNADRNVLAKATIASCCKPRAALVYIDEALEEINPVNLAWGLNENYLLEQTENESRNHMLEVEEDAAVSAAVEQGFVSGVSIDGGDFQEYMGEIEADNRTAVEELAYTTEGEVMEDFVNEQFDAVKDEDLREKLDQMATAAVDRAIELDDEEDLIGLPISESFSNRFSITDYKISKHYWNSFGRIVAELVSERYAVPVGWEKDGWVSYPGTEDGTAARNMLVNIWADGWAAFRVWRRTNAEYKALPLQDTHWVKSERYLWEREWLVGFAYGYLGTPDALDTYAARAGYALGWAVSK